MDMFSALADPNRRRIIELIAVSGKLSASDISDNFSVSAPAISQHLKVLREAKIVDMEKDAQRRVYSLNREAISDLEKWTKKLKSHWEARYTRLDKLLAEEKKRKEV